jgi:hypothetical protein
VSLLAMAVNSTAQRTTGEKYSAEEVRQDIALIKRALTERHPDLYAYVTKDSLEKEFQRIEASFTDSASIPVIYERLSSLLNNLGCGHTALALPQWFVKASHKNDKRLPFKLKVSDDKLYVTRSYLDDTTFALGWQIAAVEGHPADRLMQRFMRNYSSDGYNRTLKYRQMEQSFRDDFCFFVSRPDSLRVEFITGTGEHKELKVPALRTDTINARYARRYTNGKPLRIKPLRFKMIDSSNVAVLTIGSFHPKVLWRNRQRFKRFVRKSFREINKSKTSDLIIDLRNNPGGYPVYGMYLYSWIADSSFQYIEKMELPTRKRIRFLKYTDKSMFFNLAFMAIARSKKTGECYYNWDRGLRISQPKKKRFKGNVYVLINGNSFSNSANFSALVHHHKRAVFIGEETGGRYDGCNGTAYLLVTVPNTELRLNVPLVKNCYPFHGYPYKGRGVMPDHPVQPSINDVIKNVDTEMNYTLELVRKKHVTAGKGR